MNQQEAAGDCAAPEPESLGVTIDLSRLIQAGKTGAGEADVEGWSRSMDERQPGPCEQPPSLSTLNSLVGTEV